MAMELCKRVSKFKMANSKGPFSNISETVQIPTPKPNILLFLMIDASNDTD